MTFAILLSIAATAMPQQPTPRLQAAWLRELLDLDTAGAAASYAELASDANAQPLERLLAAARQLELRRLGVGESLPAPDLDAVPLPLREHFAAARPIPLEPLLEAVRNGTAEAIGLPQLRPFVPAVMAWSLAQERERSGRTRTLPQRRDDTARLLGWVRANEVARAELDGRTEEAAALRRRNFPSWTPPAWPGDAATVWPRLRAALQRWSQERQLTTRERELLLRLQTTLEREAEAAPGRALEIVDRLPLFAERLRAGLGA